MKKYIDLPEELLIGAYNILYHINDRPACVKANRVRKILAGEVTPGCSAATWWEFFNFLDAKLAPARPAPLSPAEWAKRARPEVTFSSEALTGMQDYAEYVAAYTAPKDLPDHCQDPCSGFAGGCVMEGHCKECAQTKKTHTP